MKCFFLHFQASICCEINENYQLSTLSKYLSSDSFIAMYVTYVFIDVANAVNKLTSLSHNYKTKYGELSRSLLAAVPSLTFLVNPVMLHCLPK